MPDAPDCKAQVRNIASHLYEHWSRSQNALMAEVARKLAERNRMGEPVIRGGLSGKALSAWIAGRQVPRDVRVFTVMRDVVKCRGREPKCQEIHAAIDHFRQVSTRSAAAVRQPAKRTARSATGASRADLERVRAISESTADDCDGVTDPGYGLRLRLRDVYVERELEIGLLDGLRGPCLTAVRGEAGSGKTALMWRLYHRLRDEGRQPMLIPATSLLRGLWRESDPGALTVGTLQAAVSAATHARTDPVLLVDTLDLLSHSPETRVEVRRLMRTAQDCRVPMVVTCRPAEAALLHLDEEGYSGYGPRIRSLLLNLFNPQETQRAIKSYAQACYEGTAVGEVIAIVQDAQVRGRPLREVVANPLTLRMLFELYAADGEWPDPDIDSIGLYLLHRERRVVTDQRDRTTPINGPDLSDDADQIALAMLREGSIEVSRSVLRGVLNTARTSEESIRLLCGRDVLAVRKETKWLWFFHQTYFEFTAALALAALGVAATREFADFVAEDAYDLFFGEVASQAILLGGRTSLMPTAEAEDLLGGWLQVDDPGLRILGLRTYARFREPSECLREIAGAALTTADDRTCKDFLRLLPSISHPDPHRWQDDLDVAWRREDLRVLAIEALTRLAAAHPGAAIAFIDQDEHWCIDWLLDRPLDQWRHHSSPHLALLDVTMRTNPEWSVRQLMRFWSRLAEDETPRAAGLADIVILLLRHNYRDPAVFNTITTTVRMLRTDTAAGDLQRSYAAMIDYPSGTPSDLCTAIRAVMHDTKSDKVWRQGQLHAIATAALRLPDLTMGREFLDQVLTMPEGSGQRDLCATVIAGLLAGPNRPTATSPLTLLVRTCCQAALVGRRAKANSTDIDGGQDDRRLWVAAVQYAHLDGPALASILPQQLPEPADWFAADRFGPFLVDAVALGNADAVAALKWYFTADGKDRTCSLSHGAMTGRKLGNQLQSRIDNAPHLLPYLIDYARSEERAIELCATLRRLPAKAVKTQPDAVPAIIAIRNELLTAPDPHQRRDAYRIWLWLLEARLDTPPSPDDLATALRACPDPALTNAIFALGIEAIEQDAWSKQNVELLKDALHDYLPPWMAARNAGRYDDPACRDQIKRKDLHVN